MRPSTKLEQDIERVLWSADQIAARVAELGEELARDYADTRPLVVGVLSGSFPFIADLVRATAIPLEVDFIAVSSYGDGARSSGVVRILKDLNTTVEGRDIVLVEDIVDTGLTLRYLVDNLRTRQPRSVRVCALLDKTAGRQLTVDIDYRGFACPDAFVVGYGLDYAGLYRNLPYVGVLKASAVRGAGP